MYMRKYTRAELLTTLKMMVDSVENNPDTELNRTMAIAMFEVILRYYNLFTQGKGDKKFIQTCYNKAKQGVKSDHKFAKYVVKFEELTRPPPLRRSARLANKRT
jgi:hypothetical protein